jgi:hypothetical protein
MPRGRAFQVNAKHTRIFAERKAQIEARLDPAYQPFTSRPVLGRASTRFEVSRRVHAVGCGGLASVHAIVSSIGLAESINRSLTVFKMPRPYFESDHVLNLAYNLLAGGRSIEDLENLRNDEGYLDLLGAQRIPDPTTAGDFCRRFGPEQIEALQEAINDGRVEVWKRQRKVSKAVATIDADGTIAPTLGVCKEGADFSYKGEYGYAPLVVSLAQTGEVLYVRNRSGNRPSHDGCIPYLDRAIALVRRGGFQSVRLRGDTDFSLTTHFDRWTNDGVEFVFGMDAHPGLVELAETLPEAVWKPMKRRPKCPRPKTKRRTRPANVKAERVKARRFKTLRLDHEHVTEIEYTPRKAKRTYRLVLLRKNISVEQGEDRLFDEIRYFFYITNLPASRLATRKVVQESNARCNQENVIEQLKNGVGAMRMPTNTLESNWTYMVIACLAWNLKAWYGLLHPDTRVGRAILKMKFSTFVAKLMQVVCQVLNQARRIVLRILNTSRWAQAAMALHDHARRRCWG